jgi:SAM-dependent methyltransferase
MERMNYKYWILKVLFKNRDHFAPLDSPRAVLDIGCGTGIWTTEFGMFSYRGLSPANSPSQTIS